MKAEQDKDIQLIRWLEGDLSEAELSAFESSEEFEDYKKIVESTKEIEIPIMDEKAIFSSIQHKIKNKERAKIKPTKVISLKKWMVAIASVAVLAFVIMSILPSSVGVTSNVGQFVSHTLPDGSEISLNGNSAINYGSDFKEDRVLRLDGEAFFEVKKGKTFAVKTDEGIITVLGTSFNVFCRKDILVVACKTGKVKVESKGNANVLEPGDRIRIENDMAGNKEQFDTSKIGGWIDGESYFSGATLQEVVLSLSSVYNTAINLPKSYQNRRFTGSFIHTDIEKALKMVFLPMEIPYSIDNQGKVVFLK